MIQRIPVTDNCWWCGNLATSREHRHKKTDIIEVFGKELGGDAIILKDNKTIDIQGPKSKLLKFPKVLCHDCNTRKSQSFDYSYDKFIKYIQANCDHLINTGQINFSEIFPDNTIEQKLNVLRYYVKHICCRLASNNISINRDIIDFLNGTSNLKYIYIKFEIRMDLIAWIERLKKRTADPGNLYIGPLRGYTKSQGHDEIDVVYSFYTYRWFRMIYFYSDKITERNYPGYKEYYSEPVVPVQALYLIDPDKYETLSDDELLKAINSAGDGYDDIDLLNEHLGANPFVK